jgi:type IV pilus assembly protein PilQ
VAMFIRALEEVTDTVVVANPKVLTLNKQKGQVIVGRRDGYLTTTVTETQAVQTVEFLETGTTLIFRPFVGDDGFVRVELHPKDSVGFVSAQGLPSEQTTEVTTNVIIRDGETILIGGLFREVTTDVQSQVPGLGSIPWLGVLFKSKNEESSREEVIILLTLHVVKDQSHYAAASEELFQDVERMRVGQRQGLMWTGRERLAQHHYRKAIDAMNAGDTKSALWHADLAIYCIPRMLPAIELREKITGKRAWDEDGTGGRSFLYRLIAQEKGYPPEMFGRPEPPALPKPEPKEDAQPQPDPPPAK